MTEKEYGNFELRLEFKVPANGNSGVTAAAVRYCVIARKFETLDWTHVHVVKWTHVHVVDWL